MHTDVVSKTDLKRISQLARKQLKLAREVEALEERAKVKRAAHEEVATRLLPDALAEAGVAALTLKDGSKIEVKPNYYCSLTGKYHDPAIQWLRKKGLDDLITQTVGAVFGKGEDKAAERVRKLLAKANVPFKTEEKVNSGSFKALVRELIENGEQVPHTDLGVTIIDMAKITPPKPRRK